MKILKSLAILFCVSLFLLSSSLKADEWDKKTIITFSGPVQVANTQLPAGTYVFKLAESSGDRHIVQIFNQDETQLITTILANPDYRLEPADKTLVKFAETGNGSETSGTLPGNGVAIKEWFYPGDDSGQEFRVVPQQQIAAVQPEPAVEPVAAPIPQAESPQAAAPATPSSIATTAPLAAQEQTAPVTPPAPAQVAQPDPAAEPQAASTELPHTASPMPLIGLIGVLSLAAAASLRIFLKMSA